MPDLVKQRLRSKFEAAVLDAGQKSMHATHGATKAAVIGAMTGTIVELGPGTGVNMRYYAPGVKVIAIEPNPTMHGRLRAKAIQHSVDLEIRTLHGEQIDVADDSVNGVVGTLLLCGVDDPHQVVNEVYRVLLPGGRYFFLEHIGAPHGTMTRRLQSVLLRPHRWAFNGCEINRDTEPVIRSHFANVEMNSVDIGAKGGHIRHFIIGTATK
jgi:ubiquinone/menaquinone biosynthesis C-methylase UbiE